MLEGNANGGAHGGQLERRQRSVAVPGLFIADDSANTANYGGMRNMRLRKRESARIAVRGW